MRSISRESVALVELVRKQSDLYSITKLPLTAAIRDGGAPDIKTLQLQWLYDVDGFYIGLPRFSTFLSRLSEFSTYGDYIRSLRQRFSIVHEMIRCGFKSNLPVHISATPIDESTELDLSSKESCERFRFIAHPGQTRVQASLFCLEELKNVILYIPKECKVDLKRNEYIHKIESNEELLKIYTPVVNYAAETLVGEPELEYNFKMPGLATGLKTHRHINPLQVPILKVANIGNLRSEGSKSDHHASRFYLQKTFTDSNRFFDLLFRKRVIIYTTSKEESISIQNRNVIRDIGLTIGLEPQEKSNYITDRVAEYLHLTRVNALANDQFMHGDYQQIQGLTSYIKRGDLKHNEVTEEEHEKLKHYQEVLGKTPSGINPYFEFAEIEKGYQYETIVKQNNYKGICIVHDVEGLNFNHDYSLLLFLLPYEYTLSRSNDSKICVINCEHPYWKTGKTYLEYIIQT